MLSAKVHSVACTSCTYPLCADILVWNRRWTFKAQLCVYISCIFVTYIYIINLLDTKSAMILIRKIATTHFLDDNFVPKKGYVLDFYKRPNIEWDTKAKHVVSYSETWNLVKFIALNNLSALHPWSAREARALWLWLSFLSRNVFIFPFCRNFLVLHNLFSMRQDIFGVMLTCGASQL